MISKCIKDSSNTPDGDEQLIIFKSGFRNTFVVFYEVPYYFSEFEYVEKEELIRRCPELESEINEL